jgi:hypothetical protein
MAKGIKTGGRTTGTPNKVSKDVREAYQALIESNLENMNSWLTEVSKENPAKALELMIRLSDFVLPKLKQIELNDNEYAYDNTAVITFVSQGLEPECYIAGKRVEK